jgi:hypothetical protein
MLLVFLVVLIAALVTLRSKHNPEEFVVLFIVLALASFRGVASGYEKDKKNTIPEQIKNCCYRAY